MASVELHGPYRVHHAPGIPPRGTLQITWPLTSAERTGTYTVTAYPIQDETQSPQFYSLWVMDMSVGVKYRHEGGGIFSDQSFLTATLYNSGKPGVDATIHNWESYLSYVKP